MVPDPAVEVVVGIYLGLLAGLMPAVVAFLLGFSFKYLTGVTVPGLGVVVLAGGLAGISGGLLGLLDQSVARSTTGVAAILVILMLSLWAHAQGDKLGASVPRWLTLKRIGTVRLSGDILERMDAYGQVRIEPLGEIEDIEGYPPLTEETRGAISSGSWKFPADLTVAELEEQLAEKLAEEFDLSEVDVSITGDGRAEIRGAPATGGLSRRVPPGKRAVSIRTHLPTGLAKGDTVSLDLSGGSVTGEVLSARTFTEDDSMSAPVVEQTPATDGGEEPETPPDPPKAATTTGGEGEVTVALPAEDARRVVQDDFAKLTVHSRGKSREFEAIDVLQRDGNQFRTVTVSSGGPLDGVTIGDAHIRDEYNVVVLAIRHPGENIVSPRGFAMLTAGDELVVTGKSEAIRTFEEAVK